MRWFRKILVSNRREIDRVRSELLRSKDIMPLLMKVRNGGAMTVEDKRLLRLRLREIALISPYIIMVVMPGGFILLPLLAWCMDRRKMGHDNSPRTQVAQSQKRPRL